MSLSTTRIVAILFVFINVFFSTSVMASSEVPDPRVPASVIVEDNILYQNHLTGIRVRGDRTVSIERCEIYLNGRAGALLDTNSDVRVSDCNIYQNDRAGISIDKASRSIIENNSIHENKNAGVRIWRSGEGRKLDVKIVGNRIHSNEQIGIRSMLPPEGSLDILAENNTIFRNNQSGVRVENDTRLTAKGNRIFENGIAGIVSYVSKIPPTLDVYQNEVSFNKGPGIHVINGITGSVGIRNNLIFNNNRTGILCGLWSDPGTKNLDIDLINNTIVSNGSNDQGVGIRNDSMGKAVIMNNIVAFNYVTGIRTRKCRVDSYNLLFANGDVGNCCDDPKSGPYWIERSQFAGCPGRGRGDLLCNPLFVDPDNYDFHLKADSPAIDAGDDSELFNDIAFPPSQGSNRNDIGATGGPYAVQSVAPGR